MEKKLNRKMLETLVEFQEKIGKLSFNKITEFLVGHIVSVLDVHRCSIFKIASDNEKAIIIAGKPENGHGLGMCFFLDEQKAIKEVVHTKKHSIIFNPKSDDRINNKEFLYKNDITAILFVPVIAEEDVIGVIVVDATNPKQTFSDEDVYFCLNLANIVSLVLERDILKQKETQRDVLNLLGEVAAEAAHRLRNPTMLISSFAKMLHKKLDGNVLQRESSIIIDQANRLESTIDGLLMFSRTKKISPKNISINEILRNSEKTVQELAEGKKDIKIVLQLTPKLPYLFIDPNDIESVFRSVLQNAVEAINKEGEICIMSRLKHKNVVICITNDGGCVPEEAIQQIFNPFFTTKADGPGLGLSIACATLRAYQGEIEVINDNHLQSTKFIINLPT